MDADREVDRDPDKNPDRNPDRENGMSATTQSSSNLTRRAIENLDEIIAERKMWSHSGPAGAGRVAKAAGVRKLVLTHLGPYTSTDASVEMASMYYDAPIPEPIPAAQGDAVPPAQRQAQRHARESPLYRLDFSELMLGCPALLDLVDLFGSMQEFLD